MRRWILSVVGAVVVLCGLPADAHHSIAGVYDSSKQLTVEGIVTRFQFINPHPFLTMDVTEGGTVEQWKLEMDNQWELAEVGFDAATLKPGDRIVVTGFPARKQSRSLYVKRLERPSDGFSYRDQS